MKCQDLLYRFVIVFSSISGFQMLDPSAFLHQLTELEVGFITIVYSLKVLWSDHFPEQLLCCEVAEFRVVQDLRPADRCSRQSKSVSTPLI